MKAVKGCITNKLNIICGYPGTGKTTITNAACSYIKYVKSYYKICLTSHTGLATTKLKDSIDDNLYNTKLVGTITKLIYDVFPKIMYRYKDYAELAPDLIIVDEFSMVDMLLFNKLLNYCNYFSCDLIILGDNNQLPPIGSGNPLRERHHQSSYR